MTAVMQLTVPDGWPVHLTWAATALGVMAAICCTAHQSSDLAS